MTASPLPITYLDHAATTPMVPEAIAAMDTVMREVGNPSSLHGSGRAARRRVEESRELIAERLGARPSEVVFLSGGTEADNLAIKGLFWARRHADPARRRVVTTAIEHHAVLDAVTWLEKDAGAAAERVAVDAAGRLDLDTLRATVERDPADVALISCMWANNEVGTVQPVSDVVAVAADHGIPVHSDAVQALAMVPVDFASSGLDAMSVASHKIGGPTGVGALVLRRERDAVALLHGGGQERDVRSGTLNTAAIVAFAVAVDLAVSRRAEETARLEGLRQRLVDRLRTAVPEAVVNGAAAPGPQSRLPHVVHVTFPGCEGDALLMLLDAQGIECSTGSACSAGVLQASHVLLAMGMDEPAARGSLRFSMGRTTTAADVDRLLAALPAVYERARAAAEAGRR